MVQHRARLQKSDFPIDISLRCGTISHHPLATIPPTFRPTIPNIPCPPTLPPVLRHPLPCPSPRQRPLARRSAAAGDGKDTKKTAASKLAAKSGASSKNVSNNPSENASKASSVDGDGPSMMDAEDFIDDRVQKLTLQEDEHGMSDRVTTGVLASQGASRDVKITSASLVFHGRVLFNDTTIEINFGRRYGLLGENGCGKSTMLKAIDKRGSSRSPSTSTSTC